MSGEERKCGKCKHVETDSGRAYCSKCGEILKQARSTGGAGGSTQGSVYRKPSGGGGGSRNRDELPAMIRFTNKLLETRVTKVADYADGVVFCEMIRAISPETMVRFNESPKMVLQRLNNVASALSSMERMGVQSSGINSKEIVGGDERQILNVLRLLHHHWKKLPGNSGGDNDSAPVEIPRSSPRKAARKQEPPAVVAKVEEKTVEIAVSPRPVPLKSPRASEPTAAKSQDSLSKLTLEEQSQEKEIEELDQKLYEMTEKLKSLSTKYATPPSTPEIKKKKEPAEPAEPASEGPVIPKKPDVALTKRRKRRKRKGGRRGSSSQSPLTRSEETQPRPVSNNKPVAAAAATDDDTGESDSPEQSAEEDRIVSPLVASAPEFVISDEEEEEGVSDSADDEEKTPQPQQQTAPRSSTTKKKKKKKKRKERLEKLRQIENEIANAGTKTSQLLEGKVEAEVNDGRLTDVRRGALESRFYGEPVMAKGMARLQAYHRSRMAQRKRKLLSKRKHIAREVVESEKTYVKNLQLCIDHFYTPMRSASFINELQIRQMFSEMAVILGYNSHLCAQLEQRQADWLKSGQKLGDIFMDLVAYFRTYTSYVNNYNDAMKLFYEMKSKSKSFNQFLMEKKVEPALSGNELPAYLIMPIQRLPRYVMLLEDLLRNTPKDHADYEGLSAALVKVQEVADYVNEKKRQAENINQVMEVQSRMTGTFKSLAEPHRRFVRQGNLLDLDHSKGERTLFLFNDLLVVGKENTSIKKMAANALLSASASLSGKRTPKMSRKGKSPFFKKKPQLQAEEDHSTTWKYQERVTLFDAKIRTLDVQRDPKGRHSSRAEATCGIQINSPRFAINLGCVEHEEMMSWVKTIDETAMKLVQRKRDRAENLAMQDKEPGANRVFDSIELGVDAPDLTTASYDGELFVNTDEGHWKRFYFYVVGMHMYAYKRKGDKTPLGWVYLLRSDVTLDEPFPNGHSFLLSVPRLGGRGLSEGILPLSQQMLSTEEEVLFIMGATSVNECLSLFRSVRHVILDAVKQGVENCPLLKIQESSADNQKCADCGADGPEYASISIGVFLCEVCADIHGSLPAGISDVREVAEPYELNMQAQYELEALMDNARRNAIFERNVNKKEIKKPKATDSRDVKEKWIKAKYMGVVETGLPPADAGGVLDVKKGHKKRLSISVVGEGGSLV